MNKRTSKHSTLDATLFIQRDLLVRTLAKELPESELIIQTITLTRRALGISQEQLAETAGVEYNTLVRFEAGDLELDMAAIARLSTALGLELTVIPANSMNELLYIIEEALATLDKNSRGS